MNIASTECKHLVVLIATLVASAYTLALPAMSEGTNPIPDNPSPQRGATNRDTSALSPATTMSTAGNDTFKETRPKLVLALSGGGLKAVAEIGVLRSLE